MPTVKYGEAPKLYSYEHQCASDTGLDASPSPMWCLNPPSWVLVDSDYGDNRIAYCPYCGEKLEDPRARTEYP
jgi:hypothetical protein